MKNGLAQGMMMGGDIGIQTDQSIDVHAQILRELDCFNEYMNNENSIDIFMDPQSILVARFDKHQVTAMDLMQLNNMIPNQEKPAGIVE